jgi:glycosyltransferase involved in cell wall biosynthesis
MNIGIDARLLERRITGIGRSLMIMLNELPKYDSDNKYFLFSYGSIPHDCKYYTNVTTVKCLLPQKIFSPIWSIFVLPFYLKKYNINILFSINQIVPLIKIRGCKYISVVNDVIYKKDRKYLPFIYRMYLQFLSHFSVKISDIIITISEYSKGDIVKHYNLNADKVKVVYPSANTEFRPLTIMEEEKNEIKSFLHLPPYVVLYVGVIENRKNILGILKVADEIFEKKKDIGFLLVGKLGHGSNKIVSAMQKRKNVILHSNIDDLMLNKLYNISNVFLFPSLYEGFGYPPLEAMQCGLPVITSNNTSLREVVGDGGILHNPHDYMLMADDILKLLADKELYARMRSQGIAQSRKFTVEKYVSGMLDVFNSFMK